MIISMLNELKTYLNFLQINTGWRICIHNVHHLAGRYGKALENYSSHNNEYCSYIKSHQELWATCLQGKSKIIDKCKQGSFYGTCHAGVGEFIVPIYHLGKVVGFISVGEFRQTKKLSQKYINYIHKNYNLPIEALNEYYNNALTSKNPDLNIISTMLTPAARMLEMIYSELKRHNIARQPSSLSTKALVNKRILGYIEQYYTTKITVKQISSFCNCSVSYISHLFKKANGINIHAFINMYRIEKAKLLLCTTCISIKDIAYDVGFADYSYFSNTFKSIVKMTPKEYRLIQSEKNINYKIH